MLSRKGLVPSKNSEDPSSTSEVHIVAHPKVRLHVKSPLITVVESRPTSPLTFELHLKFHLLLLNMKASIDYMFWHLL